MQIFLLIFIGLIIFLCVLIIASILLQEDKSGGGIGIIGGSSQSFFGASSGSILAKFTSILLTIFLISGIVVAILTSRFSTKTTITESDINRTEYSNIRAKVTEINQNTITNSEDSSSSSSSSSSSAQQ
jgi:protein translocase SecG subunit